MNVTTQLTALHDHLGRRFGSCPVATPHRSKNLQLRGQRRKGHFVGASPDAFEPLARW